MHAVATPAGRLVVFRITPPLAEDNGLRASADLRAAILSVPGPVVVVSDLREARAFAQEATERFVALMKADNPKIERSAILVSNEAATLSLQVARMLKEAAHPSRRVLDDPLALLTWMSDTLSLAERTAASSFILG